jgi:hypothetical protein
MTSAMKLTARIECGDCLKVMAAMPADYVQLVFGSPPYERARTYGIDFNLAGQEWVSWMVEVYLASLRVCTGLVAFVLQGQTKDFRWSATPALLMADLHRKGVHLRNPPIFHRVGIPGSGGPDWLRSDYEYVICATRGGKLPWSDNTACGHTPKWAPGGEMSYRNSSGKRRNQWGHSGTGDHAERMRDGRQGTAQRPSHEFQKCGQATEEAESLLGRDEHGLTGEINTSHTRDTKATNKRRVTRGTKNGDTQNEDAYLPPVKANPGNVVNAPLTLAELIDILILYEQATNSPTGKVLQDLQKANTATRLREWFYGVCLQICAAEVLQSSLCDSSTQETATCPAALQSVQSTDQQEEGRIDSGIREENLLLSKMPWESSSQARRSKARRPTTQGEEDRQEDDPTSDLREVRTDESSSNSSSGWRCDEQRPIQSPGLVPVVPSQGTQDREVYNSRLRSRLRGEGLLQHALPSLQDAWRSIDPLLRGRWSKESSNLIHCNVGGGAMGSRLAHANEAPFPERLCEFFIKSFCPEGGTVLDCFSGSGTTCAVALRLGRNAIGIDIREKMCAIARERCEAEKTMF